MAVKEKLEKAAQIRLEMGDVLVTEMVEETIVEYIRETIKRFNAVKYNAEAVAARTTTLKFEENGKGEKLYIRVFTQRVNGAVRRYTFNIEK